MGCQKLGQPDPDSNFSRELKSSLPQQVQLYVPATLLLLYSPLNGGSVPLSRQILYCSGVSIFSQSLFDLFTVLSKRLMGSEYKVYPLFCFASWVRLP